MYKITTATCGLAIDYYEQRQLWIACIAYASEYVLQRNEFSLPFAERNPAATLDGKAGISRGCKWIAVAAVDA